MVRVTRSITIHAPRDAVVACYADHARWPEVFPAISSVRQLCRRGDATVLLIGHREGTVINELTIAPPDRLDLYEAKRRYDARFVNHFSTAPDGTLVTVTASITLKGWARHLQPVLGPYIRRQIMRLQLQPLRAAAEAHHTSI